MDLALLFLLSAVTGCSFRKPYIFLSAFFGSFSGCILIAANTKKAILDLAVSILISFCMVRIVCIKAIRPSAVMQVKLTVIWYMLAFCVYGFINYFVSPEVSFLTMAGVAAVIMTAGYSLTKFCGVSSMKMSNGFIYNIIFYVNGIRVCGKAKYDSANMLVEPISGANVFVCGKETAKSILSPEACRLIEIFPNVSGEWDKRTYIRGIPYRSVSGGGIVPGIRVDNILIYTGTKKARYKSCYMAVVPENISAEGTYEYLLNYKMNGDI